MSTIEVQFTTPGAVGEAPIRGTVAMSGDSELEVMLSAARAALICMGYTPCTAARLVLRPATPEEVLV